MNAYNRVNTRANYFQTFANTANLSSRLQGTSIRVYQENQAAEKKAKAEHRHAVAVKGSGSFYMWTCIISLFS